MRAFIYILTFLFTFQPASWATVNTGSIVPIETAPHSLEMNSSQAQSMHENMSNAAHGCIYQMESGSNTPSDCLSKCMSYCSSFSALTLSVPEILKRRIFLQHPPSNPYRFISTIESPEIQPPQPI